ncbi:MAG: phosphoribosyl-AMP cyclohydrolase [Lachnospiraceae bacterium]|nr:phosphoribosyl-AMP cyclohydrolase [Lachnospiraceae bacterium]
MNNQIEYVAKPMTSSQNFDTFKLDSNGLIPCITQDYQTNEVLMMAYMNKESFEKTLETGYMVYYSRSRKKLWKKGEESGHLQFVKDLRIDCDKDTILAKVAQIGVACHTGNPTCFYTSLTDELK